MSPYSGALETHNMRRARLMAEEYDRLRCGNAAVGAQEEDQAPTAQAEPTALNAEESIVPDLTEETAMRAFDSGATRDTDAGKLDYEGFLAPEVLERFAQYMHRHRVQADGGLRASDNWQKGMPRDVYMKSLWRHFMDVWMLHRGEVRDVALEEALCAVLFNVQGYLFEVLNERAL